MNTDQLFGSLSGMTISTTRSKLTMSHLRRCNRSLRGPFVSSWLKPHQSGVSLAMVLNSGPVKSSPILWVVVVPGCVDLHNPLGEIVKQNIFFDF